jgi:hypothetical protein
MPIRVVAAIPLTRSYLAHDRLRLGSRVAGGSPAP